MSTSPDLLKHLGGVPVDTPNYAGWWGEDVLFVDYKNGERNTPSPNGNGFKMSTPTKDLADALSVAASGATIFIRPHTDPHTHGRDPREITPYSGTALNWTIPFAKHHISIIGTGKLSKGGLANETYLRGHRGAVTPTLDIIGPYATVENLGFRYNVPVTEQVNSIINIDNYDETTQAGYAATINNCTFRDYTYGSTGHAAVWIESAHWCAVLGCTFEHSKIGIGVGSSKEKVNGVVIAGNTFTGATTDISIAIRLSDIDHVDINGNSFQFAQPAGGAPNSYIYTVGAVCGGVVRNNDFSTNSSTFATACTSVGQLVDVANTCNADLVWMK